MNQLINTLLIIDMFLLVLVAFAWDAHPFAPRGGYVLVIIALLLLTLKAFGV